MEPRSTVLTVEDEAVVVAFRRHTLLPLDDCLCALQPTIPHLTRSLLHCCLQLHGISRLPHVEGEASPKRKFKAYAIGYSILTSPGVRTAQGRLHLIVAVDRTSKLVFVELHEKVTRRAAADCCAASSKMPSQPATSGLARSRPPTELLQQRSQRVEFSAKTCPIPRL
jgi:hypothetical protein